MTLQQLLVVWAVCLLVVVAVPGPAVQAQEFPTKPVRVIVPFAPGGPTDVLARVLSEGFRERTGQPFVVDNRPGGATIIGATACKNADPDGYTFCILTASTISLNPFLYDKLPYNVEKDLAPVTNLVFTQQVMLLHPSVPANSLREVIQYAKENPGKLNFGSFGIGGDSHLVFEWLQAKAGIKLTHIPYAGAAPALVAFERGDVHLLYPVGAPPVLERIKGGKAKAIAIADGLPNPNLPGVPTFSESGLPPYDAKTWFGAFAPAGAPKPVVERLSGHLAAVLKSQLFQDRFVKLGGFVPVGDTPDEFRAFVAADAKRGAELVQLSGVKLTQKP
jgi:tripartite-type tricarboxylate transporter receptor subunit TctC